MEYSEPYDIELIERYLNGELDGEELNNFEAMLLKDQKFAEKVDGLRALPGNLILLEKDRLAKEVKKWLKADKEVEKRALDKRSSSKLFNLKFMAIAAAVILFLIATGIFLQPFMGTNLDSKAQTLIAQHHTSPVVLRTSIEEQWTQAIQYYNNDQFDEMIKIMTPIIESDTATTEQYFYFALAHLYSIPEQLDKSLEYLDQTEKQDSSAYFEDITWYRALIFIRRDEEAKAKIELNKIISSERYGKNASDLLEAMK